MEDLQKTERLKNNRYLLSFLHKLNIGNDLDNDLLSQLDKTDYSKETISSILPIVLALRDILISKKNPSQYNKRIRLFLVRRADNMIYDCLVIVDSFQNTVNLRIDVDGEGGDTDLYCYSFWNDPGRIGKFISSDTRNYGTRYGNNWLASMFDSEVEEYDTENLSA